MRTTWALPGVAAQAFVSVVVVLFAVVALIFVRFCFLFEKSSLCRPGCPETCYVDQAGLKLKIHLSLCCHALLKNCGFIFM